MTITIPSKPVGKARPRFTRNGRTYKAESDRKYELMVQQRWKQDGGEYYGTAPIMAQIVAYYPIPQSVSKKKANRMQGGFAPKKPDADNVAKSILDALNGFAYADDKQVVGLTVQKLYDVNARVVVTIEPIGGVTE